MGMNLSNMIATGEMGLARMILLVLALVTAFFSYQGLALDADGFAAKGRATVFAIGTGALIYGFWSWVFSAVRDWKSTQSKVMGGVVVAIALLIITAMSSQFNVAGVNGGRILTHHNEVFIQTQSSALGERVEAVQRIEAFGADVRQARDRYATLAETEKQTGAASGSQGIGAVYNALLSTSGRLDRLNQEIAGFSRRANGSADAARQRLDRIRAINSSDKSHPERARLIKREADLLRADFAKMDAASLNAMILRTASALPNELGLLAQYSRNPNTRNQQQAALERLRAEIEGTTDTLEEALASENQAVTAPAEFKQISPTKAIRVYIDELIPEFVAGVALDWGPLALLGLILISLRETSAGELERLATLKSTSAFDLVMLFQIAHVLNDASPDNDVTKSMKKAVLAAFKEV